MAGVSPPPALRSPHLPFRQSPPSILPRGLLPAVRSRFAIPRSYPPSNSGGWFDPETDTGKHDSTRVDTHVDSRLASYGGWVEPETDTGRDNSNRFEIWVDSRRDVIVFLVGFVTAVAVSRVRVSNLAFLALAAAAFAFGALAGANINELRSFLMKFVPFNRLKTRLNNFYSDSAKFNSKSSKKKREKDDLPSNLLKLSLKIFRDVSVVASRSNQEIKASGKMRIDDNSNLVVEEDKANRSEKLFTTDAGSNYNDRTIINGRVSQSSSSSSSFESSSSSIDDQGRDRNRSFARIEKETDQTVVKNHSSSSSSSFKSASSSIDDQGRDRNRSFARIEKETDQTVVKNHSSSSSSSFKSASSGIDDQGRGRSRSFARIEKETDQTMVKNHCSSSSSSFKSASSSIDDQGRGRNRSFARIEKETDQPVVKNQSSASSLSPESRDGSCDRDDNLHFLKDKGSYRDRSYARIKEERDQTVVNGQISSLESTGTIIDRVDDLRFLSDNGNYRKVILQHNESDKEETAQTVINDRSPSSSSLSSEEFNRIVKRGSAILREAGECLKRRGDEQTAEILLYKSARLLSTAVAMNSMSSLALGHLGNACLLHGELKLKISRDLRTLLSRNKQEQSFLKKEKLVSSLVDVCDECEELLIDAGRNYKLVLSIDETDVRALYNWGLALSFRAELIADTGMDAAMDADKIYLAAIEKFDAVLSRTSDCSSDALFRWGVTLRRRSQLRPRGSGEKAKLLRQAKNLFEDVLRVDAENLQVREALRSCVSELQRV